VTEPLNILDLVGDVLNERDEAAKTAAVAYVRSYRSRSTKKRRRAKRTKEEIRGIAVFIKEQLAIDNPMTVRQCFYRLVNLGAILKTEAEYKTTVVRLLTKLRKSREIPFNWIADNTRWMRKPATHSSYAAMLGWTAQTYRRAVWDNQDAYVEIWLEKDALSGVLYSETSAWDVPLMVTRGYPSLSFLAAAAEEISEQAWKGKTTYLYYFGDYDPSGVDIPRHVEAGLRELAPDAEIYFQCVAVNPEQIESMHLATRPTKKTDSRSAGFVGESVEVDAISPSELRELVQDCITKHVDYRAYGILLEAEEREREVLREIAEAAA
jgi:hypothetical protein